MRGDRDPAEFTDVDCFLELLREELTGSGVEILEQAQNRYSRYEKLLAHIRASEDSGDESREAEREAKILKDIVDFELAANAEPSWTFVGSGLAQLNEDFVLLREYEAPHQDLQVRFLTERWGKFFLTSDEKIELDGIADEVEREERQTELFKRYFRPLWFFFFSLCQALQEGDNELNAVDAFWLGLIDEVLGRTDLAPLRVIVEYQEDGENKDDGYVAEQEGT